MATFSDAGANVQNRIAELQRKLSASSEAVKMKSEISTSDTGFSSVAALKAKLAKQHLKPVVLAPRTKDAGKTTTIDSMKTDSEDTSEKQPVRARGSSIEERIKQLQNASKTPVPKVFSLEARKISSETVAKFEGGRSASVSSKEGGETNTLNHAALARPLMKRRRPKSKRKMKVSEELKRDQSQISDNSMNTVNDVEMSTTEKPDHAMDTINSCEQVQTD